MDWKVSVFWTRAGTSPTCPLLLPYSTLLALSCLSHPPVCRSRYSIGCMIHPVKFCGRYSIDSMIVREGFFHNELKLVITGSRMEPMVYTGAVKLFYKKMFVLLMFESSKLNSKDYFGDMWKMSSEDLNIGISSLDVVSKVISTQEPFCISHLISQMFRFPYTIQLRTARSIFNLPFPAKWCLCKYMIWLSILEKCSSCIEL